MASLTAFCCAHWSHVLITTTFYVNSPGLSFDEKKAREDFIDLSKVLKGCYYVAGVS